MTNKLLTEIKEMDLSHDEVLEILKAHKEAEGSIKEGNEESEDSEEEVEAEGTDNEQNKESENDKSPDSVKIDYNTITKKLTESISKTVQSEIKKQLAILRKEAPSGEKSDKPISPKEPIKKNLFEVIV